MSTEERKQVTSSDIMSYFVNDLMIDKKETFALELGDLLAHVVSSTSRKLQGHHEGKYATDEKGQVSRLQFNNWVLEAIGDIARHLANINENMIKEMNNASANTKEG